MTNLLQIGTHNLSSVTHRLSTERHTINQHLGMEKKARKLLAKKLRMLRFMHDWSQEQLAEVSGLHRTYISSIERAERNISLDNIEKLANAFGVPIRELLRVPDRAKLEEWLYEPRTGGQHVDLNPPARRNVHHRSRRNR